MIAGCINLMSRFFNVLNTSLAELIAEFRVYTMRISPPHFPCNVLEPMLGQY